MYEVTAHAVRVGKTIEVTVSGFLPDSCHQASIVDIYPGGNIVYVKDPGVAQVFIEETTKPSVLFCTMALVPWCQTTHIYDDEHKEVEILINNKEVLQVKVIEKGASFIVIQLTGGIVPNGSCSIVPEGTPFISIYSQVFGPASYNECNEWIRSNCRAGVSALEGLSLGFTSLSAQGEERAEGGGSGNPKGLLL